MGEAQPHRRAFTNVNLLNRAMAKVEQQLAADPDNAETLRRMGDLQRKLGDFGAASRTYRKLKAMDDDAVAAWWIGALNGLNGLNGEEPPRASRAPKEVHPTPFVRMPDFLTAAQQDTLLDAVRMGPEHFDPAQVGGDQGKAPKGIGTVGMVGEEGAAGRVDLGTRVAWVAKRSVKRRIRPWFVAVLDRVVGDVFEHFGVHDMREYHVELDVTAHRGGGFFSPHRDNGSARFKSRLVSFAYYFHREPKGFAGGELLLYDTCVATDDYRATAFSRIPPLNNSLVFFPSGYYHEVLPVRASDAFENARFTVNGWLHRASERALSVRKRMPAPETRDAALSSTMLGEM